MAFVINVSITLKCSGEENNCFTFLFSNVVEIQNRSEIEIK